MKTLAEINRMTAEELEREERIAIMIFCGGLLEAEAIEIINQPQMGLFTETENKG